MKSKKLWLFTVCVLLVVTTYGQKKKDPVAHEREVRDIVAFFQYMLNTLGDAGTPNRDKDVLITESYSKIFRDGKVQIEDDLVENRFVITNKDVQAYLKDVDFFFKDVKFDYTIDEIQQNGSIEDRLYYVVRTTRNLKGTTSEGKPVNNTIKRFIEINYDAKNADLKIVSVYTNQFNETKALTAWWNELSFEWRNIFQRIVDLPDSVTVKDIKRITAIDTLDISRNYYIQNLNPLSQLLDLKVLNISNTNIEDLTPLRNLTNLVELNASNTNIQDLRPLRYALNLETLNLSKTQVDSVQVFETLTDLRKVNLSGTPIVDFAPIKNLSKLIELDVASTSLQTMEVLDSLTSLEVLNLSKTGISDISGIENLSKLTQLNLDSVQFTNMDALSSLRNLKVLSINNTPASSLDPVEELPNLERIYCDHTGIKEQSAGSFMASHPNALVIFDSEDLRGWWEDLPSVWRDVLSRMARVSYRPSKEELALVTKLDSVNLSDFVSIKNLTPLSKLHDLKVIVASNTGISDLTPLRNHRALRVIDVSNTSVNDLSELSGKDNLRIIRAENTGVAAIDTLKELPALVTLYLDGSAVREDEVAEFLTEKSSCLVIYKTARLERWWSDLSEEWREIFRLQMKMDTRLTRERLHQLTQLRKVQFGDVGVDDLSPLNEFVNLQELQFSQTSVRDLSPLAELRSLRVLRIHDNALRELAPLASLRNLNELDISNTPVDDLEVVGRIGSLLRLNCSGTQVRKLNPLQDLGRLEFLDCSNTDVRKLKPVYKTSLKTLKCYNTRISKGEINRFRRNQPECDVVYYR